MVRLEIYFNIPSTPGLFEINDSLAISMMHNQKYFDLNNNSMIEL